VSPLLAKVSGVMESLEQFHAEHVTRPVRLESYAELRRRRDVVAPLGLPCTRKFDEDARVPWIAATELGSSREVEVPFELVHLDFRVPLPEGSGYFLSGSNGLASGIALVDAICHGLWEVVERDALALFYERSPREQAARRIRLASVDDACSLSLFAKFERARVGVAVWDMTTDVGIPAFLCSVGESEFDPLRRVGTARGYGCHPDRAIALRRAVTEAAQSRLTRIAGSRDDLQPGDVERIRSEESIEHQRAHVEQESLACRSFADVRCFDFTDKASALAGTLELLRAAGLERALVVDLSRDEFPIAVARTLVPGLEGFPDAPGYRPGERALAVRRSSDS
jgi:ribosomal protein S12 methylthiotransferase accessory factor